MALTTNPVLRGDTFTTQSTGPFVGGYDDGAPPSPLGEAANPRAMTINGVMAKGAILLLLMSSTFLYAWDKVVQGDIGSAGAWMLLGGIGGFIASLVISFKPHVAPFVAPIFALLEGLLLGAISAIYETQLSAPGGAAAGFDGIVFQAVLGTLGVFTSMLLLYRSRLIRVTQRFRAIVTVAMLGVVVTYLLTFVLSLVGLSVPLIHDSGPIGIGFSLLVIGIASMMLLVDFDTIERGVATGAPKYMEWYGAFALLVTIVWIYLEMLRLLSKLRSN